MSENTIYLLSGPTASGKTAIALEWAERYDAEIVNADALCFYRGMDIGTAKPTLREQAWVPHHLIDVVDVDDRYDVARYLDAAHGVIKEILQRGKRPLVVGGSGFYLKGYFFNVADQLHIPREVREQVQSLYESGGLEALLDKLREFNPQGTGKLDLKNPRRVAPALERCLATGKPLAELQRKWQETESPFARFHKYLAWIERHDNDLVQRIEERTALMLDQGLVREVEGLLEQGLLQNPTGRTAIGYRETLALLHGELESPEALLLKIEQNTFKLVKKQRKWYQSQLGFGQTFNWSGGDWTSDDLFPRP